MHPPKNETELALKFIDSLTNKIHMLVARHCYDIVGKAITTTTSIELERGLFLAEQWQGQITYVGEEPISVSQRI